VAWGGSGEADYWGLGREGKLEGELAKERVSILRVLGE